MWTLLGSSLCCCGGSLADVGEVELTEGQRGLVVCLLIERWFPGWGCRCWTPSQVSRILIGQLTGYSREYHSAEGLLCETIQL